MSDALPFNQIKTFLTCAKERRFAKAANILNLSPAAVSMQIANLESYFQFPLFVRARSGVVLTKQGKELFFKLHNQMQDLETTIRDYSTQNQTPALKVGVSPTFVSMCLIKQLQKFYEKHPDIYVQIISSSQTVDLYTEGLHCAIRYSEKSKWPRLKSKKIFDCLNYPMCSPQLLEKLGMPEKPEDLLSFPLIHAQTRPHEWQKWFEAQGVIPKKKLDGSYFSIACQGWEAAEAGLAVVMGDAMLLIDKLKDGSLVIPFWRPLPVQYSFYFIYPENLDFKPLKKFENWLIDETEKNFEMIQKSIENKTF